MLKLTLGALAAATIATAAQAATPSPTEIVNRHMEAASKRDVNALMADYADDAVVLQAGTAVQGKAAIRALFERLFPANPPAGGAPGALGKITPSKVWEEGNVGFVSWTMGTATNGTDEFIVRDGKIAVQAVFIGGPPPAAR